MTRTFGSWLSSFTSSSTTASRGSSGRRVVLGVAAAAAFGFLVAGPATAVHADPAPAAPAPAAMVPHLTALQPNGYFCGPAATRVALSAHADAPSFSKVPTFDAIAKELGTTTDGTNSAKDTTRVLNAHLGANRYKTVEISGSKASPEHVAALQRDVVAANGRGDAVVANIAGTVTDTAGDRHSYEGGHYIAVIGHSDGGATVRIADSADTVGSPEYDVPVGTLANWTATRGYSA